MLMSYLLSLILLLLPTYLLRFSMLGIPTTVLEVLIYIVFLYGLWQASKTKFRQIPLKIWLPIGLLVIALTFSTIIPPDKKVALGEFKGFFIDPLLVFWLVFQFVKKKDIFKIFWGLIFSGGFVALYTIYQKMTGQVAPDGRVIGLFGYSPNYVALYLAPVITLTIVLGIKKINDKKYFTFFFFLISFFLNLLALYFSGSRGGFLAIAAGIGVFAIAHYWSLIKTRLSAKIIMGILIIAAFYTAWTFFQPDFSVTSATGGRVASSNNVRWQIWQTSVELGLKQPILGVGLGNFQNAFNELTKTRGNFPEYITPMALTPHNIFLMFWLSTGVLGLISFVWLLVLFFREGFKRLSTFQEAPIILAVMTAIVAYGIVESSIWKNDLSVIFWVFWGLIWVI